ncbi:MAG: DUF4105 domain-containing protein [Gemmatimonadetes bacterium]|nr:DUF4105 domain-containing protein [Gemmatimonadota bacterium]
MPDAPAPAGPPVRRSRLVLAAVLGLVALFGLWWAVRRPSLTRTWAVDQSVLPAVTFAGDTVTIEGVRNFRWTSATAFTPAWDTRTYDLSQVTSAWYVLVPFSDRWRGPAHAFVSFGFADGRYLAVSVEARRELGETYGVFTGMLRHFELIYVVGDERDLIGRRAVYDDDAVFLYPIKGDPAGFRAVLTAMLERANQLRTRPEWYNTLTNNCTLNLVRHVNALVPGKVPLSWRIAFPGYSDEVVHRVGLIDSTGSMAEQRARFQINDRARAALDSAEFSARIRE